MTSFNQIENHFFFRRLDKHLGSRKGSRTGNSGNHLELQVLTQIEYVPWIHPNALDQLSILINVIINSKFLHEFFFLAKELIQFSFGRNGDTTTTKKHTFRLFNAQILLLEYQANTRLNSKWFKVKNTSVNQSIHRRLVNWMRRQSVANFWLYKKALWLIIQLKQPTPTKKWRAVRKAIGAHSKIATTSLICISAKQSAWIEGQNKIYIINEWLLATVSFGFLCIFDTKITHKKVLKCDKLKKKRWK